MEEYAESKLFYHFLTYAEGKLFYDFLTVPACRSPTSGEEGDREGRHGASARQRLRVGTPPLSKGTPPLSKARQRLRVGTPPRSEGTCSGTCEVPGSMHAYLRIPALKYLWHTPLRKGSLYDVGVEVQLAGPTAGYLGDLSRRGGQVPGRVAGPNRRGCALCRCARYQTRRRGCQ
eukprot:160796-Rhodomonas_salina.1